MAYVYRGTLRAVEPEPEEAVPVFDPTLCGTPQGHKQHRKFGTTPCRPCKDVDAAYHRDYRARRKAGLIRKPEFNPDMCGTTTGYSRHKRHKVPTCDACLAARAVYKNEYNASRRAA